MKQVPRGVRFVVAGVLVLLVLAAGGRYLLRTPSTSSPSRASAMSSSPQAGRIAAAPLFGTAHTSDALAPSAVSNSAGSASAANSAAAATTPTTSGGSASTTGSAVTPVGPQIVRTASVSLKVGKGNVPTTMSRIANLAATDGGYVQSSSMSVGTAQAAASGQMVIEVDSADLTSALADLSFLGNVTAEQTAGQDVTSQVAENAATLDVLQQEVNVLDAQLSKATDVSDILQIQGQLFPVAQQLQQLQSQQAALETSAELAALTINLNAPAVAITPPGNTRPGTDAAVDAWHYLRHNTLAVLDGIAVAGGWALPLGVLGALVWFVVSRIVRLRRRRPGVTPA